MAYTAVPLIAGVTISAFYTDFATTPPWASGTAAVQGVDWDVDGAGVITILRNQPCWLRFTFTDGSGTIAGTPEFPAITARLTADATACPSGPTFYDMASQLSSIHNDELMTAVQTQSGIYDGTNFDIAFGSDGIGSAHPVGATLLLEFDLTISDPEFWTDNERTIELSRVLSKPPEQVLVPEVVGQPEIGPSEFCVPIAPPDPPGGGAEPPPGGGGSGSGPPGGGYPVCIWQWIVATDSDGNPTNPPQGAWIPTNAPCSGAP